MMDQPEQRVGSKLQYFYREKAGEEHQHQLEPSARRTITPPRPDETGLVWKQIGQRPPSWLHRKRFVGRVEVGLLNVVRG